MDATPENPSSKQRKFPHFLALLLGCSAAPLITSRMHGGSLLAALAVVSIGWLTFNGSKRLYAWLDTLPEPKATRASRLAPLLYTITYFAFWIIFNPH